MAVGTVVGRAAGVLVTGAVGAAAYDGLKTVARGPALRRAAVVVTSWGLRGARTVETGAERVRLGAADVVAEARAELGEQAPPPGRAESNGHEH